MHAITLALVLLALTCVSSILHRLVRLPLPILQIAVGTIAALPPFRLHVGFDPHAFLLLFIPPLLFADGWRLPRRELQSLRGPVLAAAIGLVLATVLIGGYFLHWLIPVMPLSVAFAVAAVVSPTDATALAAIIGRLTMPSRLQHVLESEALLNDASGLVALRFAVAATLTGQFSWPNAAGTFLLIAVGGLAIGWAAAIGLGWLTRRLALQDDDAPIAAILSALLPFGAYWIAEQAHVSGILAAVAAGMTANRTGLMEHAHYSARMQSGSMWRLITYAFNGVIFVLLGSQLPGIIGPEPGGLDLISGNAPFRVIGWIVALGSVLTLVRLAWIALTIGIERLFNTRARPQSRPTPGLRLMLAGALGGVRGAITLAGILTLPLVLADGSPFPSRDLAITLATGIILLSLAVASIALPLLLSRTPEDDDTLRTETRIARIAAMEAAVEAIRRLAADGAQATPEHTRVLQSYDRRLAAIRANGVDDISDEEATWRDLHAITLKAERDAVHRLRASNEINDEAARQVVQEIDLQEAASMRRPLRMKPDHPTRIKP